MSSPFSCHVIWAGIKIPSNFINNLMLVSFVANVGELKQDMHKYSVLIRLSSI